jgi:hypothetical protein
VLTALWLKEKAPGAADKQVVSPAEVLEVLR